MRLLFVIAAAACCLTASTSLLAERVSAPFCFRPYKPFHASKSELQAFKDEVANYQRCIETFVSEQEDAIRAHRKAANDAIEEWNLFLRLELR